MDYFAGLEVSVRDTSVCVIDEAGNSQAVRLGAKRSPVK